MPYIIPETKKKINSKLKSLIDNGVALESAGNLNYTISQLIIAFVDRQGGPNYNTLNAAIGVLSCLDKEFYRRIVALYEDKKMKINGDVF